MHARRNACRVAGAWALLVSALLVLAADPAIAADDPAELIGTPASVAIEPAEATLSGRRATAPVDRLGDLRRRLGPRPDPRVEWVEPQPGDRRRLAEGAGRAQGRRHGHDRGAAGERRGRDDRQGRAAWTSRRR